MADSQNTIALRAEIAQVEKKLKALQAAGKGLGGDAEDLYGNKYDEMKDDETKAIKEFKSNFDDKKSSMMEKIHSQERVLAYKLNSLNTQLRFSEIWDAITNK